MTETPEPTVHGPAQAERKAVPQTPREEQVYRIIEKAKICGFTISTAESLTGGGIFNALTSLPGGGATMDQGAIVYSDIAKSQLLAVPDADIQEFSSVSIDVANRMALGILQRSATNLAVSATGFAGPSGRPPDQETKPAGTLFIGIATQPKITEGEHEAVSVRAFEHKLSGTDRAKDRQNAIDIALNHLENTLDRYIRYKRLDVPKDLLRNGQFVVDHFF